MIVDEGVNNLGRLAIKRNSKSLLKLMQGKMRAKNEKEQKPPSRLPFKVYCAGSFM